MHPAFAQLEHRPWPMPEGRWSWSQAWLDLLFIHFEVDADELKRTLPAGLELDLFEGKAWIGIVPFRMEGVSKRGWPSPSWLCDFAEINVRTYVRKDGKAGVWFLSLDVANPVIASFARFFFHLPYFGARLQIQRVDHKFVYRVRRNQYRFEVEYNGGVPAPSASGNFAHWSTERYCLYSADHAGRLFRAEVQHRKWPLEAANARIILNTFSPVKLGPCHPEIYFSPRVDVAIWPLEQIV